MDDVLQVSKCLARLCGDVVHNGLDPPDGLDGHEVDADDE